MNSAAVLNWESPRLTEGLRSCTLSEIGNYVPNVLGSRAADFFLQISSPGKLDFVVERHSGAGLEVWVQVQTWRTETALQQFLEEHGLPRPEVPAPRAYEPMLPLICDLSPSPTEVGQLLRLAEDLFRSVCGLGEHSELTFCYYMM
jgi:hypothetical protein